MVVVVLPAAGAVVASPLMAPAVVPPAAAPVEAESVLMALPVAGAVVSAVPAAEEDVSVEVVLPAGFDSQEVMPMAKNRADTFSRFFILWCRFEV